MGYGLDGYWSELGIYNICELYFWNRLFLGGYKFYCKELDLYFNSWLEFHKIESEFRAISRTAEDRLNSMELEREINERNDE